MKSWNNLFEELFTDFEQELPFETFANGGTLPGWLWECDDAGVFVECSPEVEDVLGYSPHEILGQLLTEFGLSAKSARKLSNVLRMGNLPTEISIEYITKNGDQLPVSLFVYNAITTGGVNTGLRGFAQVVLDLDEITSTDNSQTIDEQEEAVDEIGTQPPAEAVPAQLSDSGGEGIERENIHENAKEKLSDVEEKPDGIKTPQIPSKSECQVISEMIFEGLEDIRIKTPEICDSPMSRVTVTNREDFRVDRTKEPLMNETLAGKVVHAYPKVLTKETELRLEWGIKFDFTEEERAFLSRYRLCPPGLQGFLQRRLAPKSILKSDFDWISVVILDEQGKDKQVWVNYFHESTKSGGWKVDEVLEKPELVIKEVERVISKPRKVREILLRGENYLLG